MRPIFALIVLLFTGGAATCPAAELQTLWAIGKADGGNAEFALAPKGFASYREDGFFVVGRSEPGRDWPYVHPGPSDGWAGSRSHAFAVVFGLKEAGGEGDCLLRVDLLDTHAGGPPRLTLHVNGEVFEKRLAAGAGDASIQGEPARGRRQSVEFVFPARLLAAGENHLQLVTSGGSWMLYDAVTLQVPGALALVPSEARTLVDAVTPVRALRREGDTLTQSVQVVLRHFGDPVVATVRVEGAEPRTVPLSGGCAMVEVALPAVTGRTERGVAVEVEGRTVVTRRVVLQPVRRMVVYILPHSHTDIGYTDIQTAIEDKQVENLRKGLDYARRTASYPPGARFVWNVEVLWAADLFLQRRPESERREFLEAVRRGQVVLNGMYLNELTGLCRTEELVRLFEYATTLGRETGVPIDSVMISDVPGYTWGTVTAMHHAGIRYFSTAPNYFDRIGDILQKWENKPFWWIGPSGREKVLVWIPFKGYAMSHAYRELSPEFVSEYQDLLERAGYPFDIAHMRWSGHGDNAEPDPAICDFVKDWNSRYAWPRFIISGTSEAFRAFEARYGDQIPEVRGDWTPYWEDGAGSSALETAMNRASSDRVAQAEAIHAMTDLGAYPAEAFRAAWNQVLLYSEHTWGAWCSVSDPEAQATREQWAIKRSYALEADRRSRELLAAVAPPPGGDPVVDVDVVNAVSWSRGGLVTLPATVRTAGDRVHDPRGRAVPSQRLSDGSLVFLAHPVPPFARQRYQVTAGEPLAARPVRVEGAFLDNGRVRVAIDEATGAIRDLRGRASRGNLIDGSGGEGLNEYLFLPGDNPADLKRNGPVRIRAGETGPLVASLVIESEAPGCRRLVREVRLVAGLDEVELINTVDKEHAAIPSKPNDWQFAQKGGKESVNFAFPFAVPGGALRLELPMGVIRPEADQLPSACKNWFTLGRWADVSGRRGGVQWISLDAPLVQVGGITATLVGSQSDPEVWRKQVEPTQRFYAWAMNNHWGTNYRAYQEGPVVFRFVLRLHDGYDAAENARAALDRSQPLLAAAPSPAPGGRESALIVTPEDVLVTGLKPSADGRAMIVRLYGASGRDCTATLRFGRGAQPSALFLSGTGEEPVEALAGGAVAVPGHGLVTVRVEFGPRTAAR